MEQRLKDLWLVTWHHNLETKSLSSYYRVFKTDFGREQYLEKLTKGDRLLVTKFRTCNNRLLVNVGGIKVSVEKIGYVTSVMLR